MWKQVFCGDGEVYNLCVDTTLQVSAGSGNAANGNICCTIAKRAKHANIPKSQYVL